MDHARCCDLLADEVERAAGVVAEVPAETVVPSCPEWNVGDLVLHLGRVHRWADGLVVALADEPQAATEAFADPGPPTARWLRSGGASLLGTLRAADPDAPMWAWGADQHVRFWSRRQLHETLVHRIDAELAGGLPSTVAPEVAADGIDELLVNLPAAARFSPKVANLRGDGRRLALETVRRRAVVDDHPRGGRVLGRDRDRDGRGHPVGTGPRPPARPLPTARARRLCGHRHRRPGAGRLLAGQLGAGVTPGAPAARRTAARHPLRRRWPAGG